MYFAAVDVAACVQDCADVVGIAHQGIELVVVEVHEDGVLYVFFVLEQDVLEEKNKSFTSQVALSTQGVVLSVTLHVISCK